MDHVQDVYGIGCNFVDDNVVLMDNQFSCSLNPPWSTHIWAVWETVFDGADNAPREFQRGLDIVDGDVIDNFFEIIFGIGGQITGFMIW